uniref:Tetrahydromethanopterin:alpha-L-glutamate ligase n=1 Tax=Candidatus Methanophaga sp. ANME-1 ERB7 TaxID=2759913 RepID=A0A7G9Z4Y9_9EURY|nr:tetrahydromethanopterin:alpha-L-glutamate ligase [Methanosarcinales archaeon ANME-1 ERB7]
MQTSDKNTKTANIGVVITDPDDWTANALMKNIRKRGANAIPITLATLSASVSDSDFAIFDTDLNDLLALDAIIVRDVGISFALEQISFKFDLLRQFETANIPVMNSPTAIQNAANKFFSFYLFKQVQLPIPRTVVTSDLGVALKATKEFEIAVAKPIFGSQGKGIVKLESTQPDMKQKLATLLKKRGVLYLQQFVPNPGRDIRAFVVGEEALGAIYRISQIGSFISNLSQGGTALMCDLTEEMRALAVNAAKAVDADFAGVDLIEGDKGLFVLEVNATPSGKGIKLACGIDVTERIIGRMFEREL